MLTRRDKIILSLLAALFIVLTVGSTPMVLDWWCVAFPGQSPIPAAAGEVTYGLRVLELLQAAIG